MEQTTALFPKIPLNLTLREKIEIILERHENNYFLNQDLGEIEDYITEIVKPNFKVTEELLNKYLTRDSRAKIKKLYWVTRNNEDFAYVFNSNIDQNKFASVRDAQIEAAKIYKDNCEFYQKSKATVYSENGNKLIKRKRIDCQNNEFNKEINDDESPDEKLFTKEICFEALKNNYLKISKIFSMNNKELDEKLSEQNESIEFIKKIEGYIEPTTLNDKLSNFLAVALHKAINDL